MGLKCLLVFDRIFKETQETVTVATFQGGRSGSWGRPLTFEPGR